MAHLAVLDDWYMGIPSHWVVWLLIVGTVSLVLWLMGTYLKR